MEAKETKQIGGNRFLRLFERTYEHEGHTGKWLFASRDENPPKHEDKKPDAVITNNPQEPEQQVQRRPNTVTGAQAISSAEEAM